VIGLLICGTVPWACPAPAPGQNDEDQALSKIAAAFVYNFAQYTQWPQASFPDDEAPLVITVVGSEKFARLLSSLVSTRRIGGRRVRVVRAAPPDPNAQEDELRRRRAAFTQAVRASHLVYIDHDHPAAADAVIDACRGHDVLTVGYVPGFARAGGMLGLKLRDKHMVFEANTAAINSTRLQVSSKVLRLAEIVGEEGEGGE
jgi:hypothetical protein